MLHSNSILDKLRPVDGDPRRAFQRLPQRHQLAVSAVTAFYMFSVYVAYALLEPIHVRALSSEAVYLWPVAWIEYLGLRSAPQVVAIGTFILALACVLSPGTRALRALFAVFALMAAALTNSYGGINHGYHIWVWIAAILIIAPSDLKLTASRRDKVGLLTTISGVQLFILLTYSLAGLHKFKAGLGSLMSGDAGNFSFTGFAGQIADRSLQTETQPIAADFLISHHVFFAPIFWGLIFCQLFALAVIFFPRLHRSFGLLFIGFHFGTWALMEISFPLHVVWLMLFFVCSPFRPQDNSDSPLVILKALIDRLGILLSANKVRVAKRRPRRSAAQA